MNYIKKYFLSENDNSQSIKANRRNALKTLFEAVLAEETKTQQQAGDILQSKKADTEVANLSPEELKKLKSAMNIRIAMVRAGGGGTPTGGNDSGNVRQGRRTRGR